eukprot:15148042-Ditylum_brightwellii.AAC.1
MHGQCIRTHFEYSWPHQGRLSTAEWKRWEYAIRITFELGWKYSLSEDRLFQFVDDQWESRNPVLERRGQMAHC